MNHPCKNLGALIHSSVRFSPIATLQNLEDVDFRFRVDLLEASNSALSQFLTALSGVGLISVRKEPADSSVRTWVGLTTEKRAAFARHLATLQEILEAGQEAIPLTRTF